MILTREILRTNNSTNLRFSATFIANKLGEPDNPVILTILSDRLFFIQKFSINKLLQEQTDKVCARFGLDPAKVTPEVNTLKEGQMQYSKKWLRTIGARDNDLVLAMTATEDPYPVIAVQFCDPIDLATANVVNGFKAAEEPA